jgi:hypothetical protein
MPNNPTIKGDNTVLFGSAGFYSGSGILVSGNKKLSGDKLEVKDQTGYVVATIYFNDKNEFSFEMIVKTAAPTLDRGDEITLASLVALVDDVEEMWKQDDVRRLRVTATRYLGMTLGS